ncbi:SRPBCC family protein [Hymenobacter cellulosilyticus]|uniref:SRPBCC family protein n=1 Tax=Hymenobacter cellulosilyticus TaxID=2932248 RepID=A0A8T9Q3N1_9BACT|nr:SRPBCC family protein [Hymenobacter cellulosilyticus]UOQ71051.1 SRPBCC family protein [Hymenobacter cellulosilyticus]
MAIIEVETRIQASPRLCYTLALSVDLHSISAQKTQESIVGGIRSGVLQLGDVVTFRARHFGIWQTLTSKITEAEFPVYFCDEMQQGAFKSMRHEHHFVAQGSGTLMRDVFTFQSPYGLLGRAVDFLLLEKYLRAFLVERGSVIKHYAESGAWQKVIKLKDS